MIRAQIDSWIVGMLLCCPRRLSNRSALWRISKQKQEKLEACLSACSVTCRREAVQSVGTSADNMHIIYNLKADVRYWDVGCKLVNIFIFGDRSNRSILFI